MANSAYVGGPGGYNLTTSGGMASRFRPDDIMGFAREMSRRAARPAAPAGGGVVGAARSAAAPVYYGGSAPEAAPRDPNAGLRARAEATELAERAIPWYTWEGAARGQRGIMSSPGVVPGYAPITNMLPPHLRPQAAGMVMPPSDVPTGSIGLRPDEYSHDARMRRAAGSGPVSFNTRGAF